MKACVFGLGLSGKSAAKLLLSRGDEVVAIDGKAAELRQLPEVQALLSKGLRLLSEEEFENFEGLDFAVLSPGIPFTHPLVARAMQEGLELIGEVELAFRLLKSPLIGITGTNGKTTVTLLVEHILNYAGKKARALGNVGVPLTSAIEDMGIDEIGVVELSSYQLEVMKTACLDAAALLNITPDHLDRYGTMENYAQAKLSIINRMKKEGSCLLNETISSGHKRTFGYNLSSEIATDLKSIFVSGKELSALPEFLQGKKSHHLENFLAAFALCQTFGVSPSDILKGYETFKAPSHRIEFVATVKGVHFYNDSKGTNIDAVIRAVEFLSDRPIYLIAGGVDKGSPYTAWISTFKNKVKEVFAIGQAAKKIQDDLQESLNVIPCEDLEGAIEKAFLRATPGDCILLSPGCASFDMFMDYKHRGNEFIRLVTSLKEKLKCQEEILL